MRAVNLIPAEERRGAGGLAGRSGGIVYVVAGGLAVLVALGVIYAFAVHSVANRKADLAAVTQQVAAVTAESQELQPYVQIATISADKVEQVATLAQQRFNWPTAMAQLALALPSDVSFVSLSANPGGSVAAGASAAGVSSSGEAFNLVGCANSQGEVPAVLTDLASVPGVTGVALVTAAEANGLHFHAVSTKINHGGSVRADAPSLGVCPKITWTINLDYAASYTVPKVKLPQGSSGGAQTVSTRSGATSPIVQTASQQVTP